MNDLMDRLHDLGSASVDSVSDDVVRRDVLRGRGALLRKRVRRGVAGLSIAAVAAVGVTTIVVDQDSRSSVSTSDVGLVAWTGKQLPGFVIEKVPAGFVLQGATPYNLDVARADDRSDLAAFEDKLVVMLESQDVTGTPEGKPVKVGAYDGWLRSVEGGTQVLTYDDGTHRVVVQAWKSLGLTDAQVVEFAQGVTVTAEAQAGRG